MLHFIIGVAICIWIAERVTHWLHGRRYRKLVARMLSTSSPEPRTSKLSNNDFRVATILTLITVCIMAAAATMH